MKIVKKIRERIFEKKSRKNIRKKICERKKIRRKSAKTILTKICERVFERNLAKKYSKEIFEQKSAKNFLKIFKIFSPWVFLRIFAQIFFRKFSFKNVFVEPFHNKRILEKEEATKYLKENPGGNIRTKIGVEYLSDKPQKLSRETFVKQLKKKYL